ncbi:MAG: DUF2804 family protein [Candidatus Izemoplasmatales bacterium]|nr:DUF2804 family protein [Candidatus Izemoplasmatales bacterium]MDD3865897.1 DUF2804 family protein [Candidatus Izemoplasmatales bacterium]
MKDYGKLISVKRQSVSTPNNLVDNGQAVFGTFDKEFERMDLISLKNPVSRLYPNFLNKLRLTLWEATEVHLDNGVLLAVVCDMGIFGMTLNVFYDKRTKKVYSWSYNLASSKTTIAPNLINGSIAEAHTKNSSIQYINHFEVGKCALTGNSKSDKAGNLAYEFALERVSLPSIVSIPFGDNKPLYSQKDLFKVKGYVEFNGERFEANDTTTAIIDDHRGYYPYRQHYDWLTTMGRPEIGGKCQYFAFNLTRNQSINQEEYNENLIWFEGKTSLLPPVKFKHDETGDVWTVKDEHDMVNITYNIADRFKMVVHPLVLRIDYFVTFGEIKGYIRDLAGKKYLLDGMMGIGEDKTLRF